MILLGGNLKDSVFQLTHVHQLSYRLLNKYYYCAVQTTNQVRLENNVPPSLQSSHTNLVSLSMVNSAQETD